ncbi:uncharacterized protein LOC106651518 isoform X1 [Trichogramma pretiosum]|uniref:uncharacterized protein LOC106651518 isoform X1 n=2 Tax=Trichogramma pretiosum TaxID=7493 RepID=UPI0006C9C280|nr:uncharacterized protein LOC106651518 isoform X1 [Trichogramma pretiosum]
MWFGLLVQSIDSQCFSSNFANRIEKMFKSSLILLFAGMVVLLFFAGTTRSVCIRRGEFHKMTAGLQKMNLNSRLARTRYKMTLSDCLAKHGKQEECLAKLGNQQPRRLISTKLKDLVKDFRSSIGKDPNRCR